MLKLNRPSRPLQSHVCSQKRSPYPMVPLCLDCPRSSMFNRAPIRPLRRRRRTRFLSRTISKHIRQRQFERHRLQPRNILPICMIELNRPSRRAQSHRPCLGLRQSDITSLKQLDIRLQINIFIPTWPVFSMTRRQDGRTRRRAPFIPSQGISSMPQPPDGLPRLRIRPRTLRFTSVPVPLSTLHTTR
ncbi:hypothetical protein B0H16DRAFT_1558290 [Mycena metata]|uniref:Uncharacterized protein n=1 Tax=Mycena metata TaxID=1033252 RepID=A0AAD7ILD0_9AGAR|nr:hypothetical protein B0H16DRAFT_1558290 [Mycena metata]